MNDYSELKEAATRIIEVQPASGAPFAKMFSEFDSMASPEVVVELIAEVEALRKEIASLNPFKFDTNETTIGYTGCVICGQYTNHGGLQCPKLVYHSLSMENQRIVPVEQIRTDHPLESFIRKVHNK